MKIKSYKALENAEFAMSVHQIISSSVYGAYFSTEGGYNARQTLLDKIKNYNSLNRGDKKQITSILNTIIKHTA
jgi:hypothetical protein